MKIYLYIQNVKNFITVCTSYPLFEYISRDNPKFPKKTRRAVKLCANNPHLWKLSRVHIVESFRSERTYEMKKKKKKKNWRSFKDTKRKEKKKQIGKRSPYMVASWIVGERWKWTRGGREERRKKKNKKGRKVDVSSVRKRLIRRDRGSLRCERLLHSKSIRHTHTGLLYICMKRGA